MTGRDSKLDAVLTAARRRRGRHLHQTLGNLFRAAHRQHVEREVMDRERKIGDWNCSVRLGLGTVAGL